MWSHGVTATPGVLVMPGVVIHLGPTMSSPNAATRCPHCGEALRAFTLPDDAGFDEPYHLACFNDECSYYKEGWEWMQQQYEAKASYRYRINPRTSTASALPVWSPTAITDRIIELPDADDD